MRFYLSNEKKVIKNRYSAILSKSAGEFKSVLIVGVLLFILFGSVCLASVYYNNQFIFVPAINNNTTVDDEEIPLSTTEIKNIYFSVGGEDNILQPVSFQEYTIQKGDTLWDISKKYQISVDSIYSCNLPKVKNPHFLNPGNQIAIPSNIGILRKVSSSSDLDKIMDDFQVDELSLFIANNVSSMEELISLSEVFLPNVELPLSEKLKAYGLEFGIPARGYISSYFGYRRDPFTKLRRFHAGIDIANRYGAPVYSSYGGVVIYAEAKAGYGLCIIIQHPIGYSTLYGHLSSILIQVGKYVKKGAIIGKIGSSGRSTGPHLHFEIRKYGKILNPINYALGIKSYKKRK